MGANIIDGNTGKWEMVIGLEVHAQVISASKLFSRASTDFSAEPNTNVALFDVAMPGTLPVLNSYCVEQAVKTALALSCTVNKYSVFDRKNYFYPDLAPGYQITQFYFPIASNGHIILDECGGKKIGISRIHLEQDAGKSIHEGSATYVDFNRAGVALMEIVSEPDFRSDEEVSEYLRKMRAILRCIGSCDGDMENGSLRCDANVSVRRVGDSALGVRSEIKNLNSIKYVAKAIRYEAHKQVELLERGEKVEQATVLFDVEKGVTKAIRDKEDACDYRYFPDPDLLPLKIKDEFIDGVRRSMPELPHEKKMRYMNDFGLSAYDANILTLDKDVSAYFESIASKHSPELAVQWVTVELFGSLNKRDICISDSPVSADDMIALLDLIVDGTISGRTAKEVFAIMFETKKSASEVVNERGLQQISSEEALLSVICGILERNPDKVAEYKQGKVKLFAYFVGQVMKETGGRASPELVNAILGKKLN